MADSSYSESWQTGSESARDAIEIALQKMNGRLRSPVTDWLAVEAPLEIRLGLARERRHRHQRLTITMRTPGHDGELALGFLFNEGILSGMDQVRSVRHCGSAGGASGNVLRIDLHPGAMPDLRRAGRRFFTHSGCGVCGKESLEALSQDYPFSPGADRSESQRFSAGVISRLPRQLRRCQAVFDRTGGLHAAALFAADGTLRLVREDIGRHNAVDKVIGAAFQHGRLPLHDSVLLVSGRASFELMQKAAMAGLPVLAAVGAPSSLAVDLARERDMTLLGFVRDDGFNIYHAGWRITPGRG